MDRLANVLGAVLVLVPGDVLDDIAGEEANVIGHDVFNWLNAIATVMASAFLPFGRALFVEHFAYLLSVHIFTTALRVRSC